MDVLFSIITINRNNAQGLEETFVSVQEQTCRNFEYIVIDGKSEDGSLKVVKKYENIIDYYVSEKDKGVYNALNKGIAQAKGKYLIFMNSGDVFASSDVLMKVKLAVTGEPDFIFGETIYKKQGCRFRKRLPRHVSFFLFYTSGICHQSSFIKRDLFEEIGYYNEEYKLTSDWTFFMKALGKYNKRVMKVDFPISVYDMEGMSGNPLNQQLLNKEREKFLQEEFPFFCEDYRFYLKLRKYLFLDLRQFLQLRWFQLKIRFKNLFH